MVKSNLKSNQGLKKFVKSNLKSNHLDRILIKSNLKSNQGVKNYVKSNHDQIKSCSFLVKSSNQIIKSNSLDTHMGVQIGFLEIKSNLKSNPGVQNYVKSNHARFWSNHQIK